MRKILRNYFEFGPVIQDMSFKDILLATALAAIWFGRAEPFMQY